MSDRTEYIDKQATIGAIHSAIYSYFCGAEDGDELSEDEKLVLSINKAICTAIKAMPRADVQPVRRGHWAEENGFIYCPFCGDPWGAPGCESMVKSFNYCPNCGAKMDEVK